jgi:hypothetical protein
MALGSTCSIHGTESILPLYGSEVWSEVVRLRRPQIRTKVRDLILRIDIPDIVWQKKLP